MSSLDTFTNLLSYLFTIVKGTIVASTGISILLSALLYFKQTALIYPSNLPTGARKDVPSPNASDDWEEVRLNTRDGETLHSYFLKARDPSKRNREESSDSMRARKPLNVTVLFMHGNAGNIGHRLPIAQVFSNQMGCNIFMLGYRGYGKSSGRPSEKGLLIDAQTALDYLLEKQEIRHHRLFIYGQSLGGALAIQLASKNQEKIHGLILENTFRSMRTLIPSAFPPAKYLARLCHQIWPSETTLPWIRDTPVLFLSGEKDELVPPEHMAVLYNKCKAPKVWKGFANGTHNDTVGEEGYFKAVDDFILKVLKGKISTVLEQIDATPSNKTDANN